MLATQGKDRLPSLGSSLGTEQHPKDEQPPVDNGDYTRGRSAVLMD